MANDKQQKTTLAIIVLGIIVTFFTSTIKLHRYTLSANQLTNDNKVDKYFHRDSINSGAFIENRTAIATDKIAFHPWGDSEDLFDLDKIPVFMKDYFEWHGEKLQQIKSDAKALKIKSNVSNDNGDYLSRFRFLVLRCASGKRHDNQVVSEDRCGGLSDRLKPFPLFLWYAATTNRILFIRWGSNRPAPIETFMVPGNVWNWTFPDELFSKIEKLEESNSMGQNSDETFPRLYFDGSTYQHKQMLDKIGDQAIWMIEGNDFTGGYSRYENFVTQAIELSSVSNSNHPKWNKNTFIASKLKPSDALYENFYHDLFHATSRPSLGVNKLLSAYFYDPKFGRSIVYDNKRDNNEAGSALAPRSWLPIPLKRNRYAVAHYRAKYPREPYRETQNQTLLRETTIHAVECAKSRVSGLRVSQQLQNSNSTRSAAQRVSAVYVASDTALVIESVRDVYHNRNSTISKEGVDPRNIVDVWTYLDLLSYDDRFGSNTLQTKRTISLAEDPPHLNFAQRDDLSEFYVIFVDLFLMSYASCVVYGAGGFGRMGSLVSYRPSCGMPYTVNHGILKHCDPYD